MSIPGEVVRVLASHDLNICRNVLVARCLLEDIALSRTMRHLVSLRDSITILSLLDWDSSRFLHAQEQAVLTSRESLATFCVVSLSKAKLL